LDSIGLKEKTRSRTCGMPARQRASRAIRYCENGMLIACAAFTKLALLLPTQIAVMMIQSSHTTTEPKPVSRPNKILKLGLTIAVIHALFLLLLLGKGL
jgi:hypothetical protein